MENSLNKKIEIQSLTSENIKEKESLKVSVNDIISLLITLLYFFPMVGETFTIIQTLNTGNFLSKLPKLLFNITFCTIPLKRISKMIKK